MNIEEAKKIAKGITKDDLLNYWEGPEEPYEAIQVVLNELDKKDKVIDMMTECIDGEPTFGYGHLRDINTPEKVKEYFYNKVEIPEEN